MIDPATRSPRPHRDTTRALPSLAAAAVLALALAACTGGAGGAASPSIALPASTAPSGAPSEAPATEPADGAIPQAVIDNAVADAADRSGVDPAAVTVVAAEARDWPDGALGCPEPGMMYAQVITPGYRVVVEAGGTQYDYRASTRSSDVQWCENPPAT